jgi:hypothetical protein
MDYELDYFKTIIELVDLSGRPVLIEKCKQGNEQQIDLGQLQSGIYFLIVTEKKKTFSTPIILQKH